VVVADLGGEEFQGAFRSANSGAGSSSWAGEETIAFSLFIDIPAVGDARDAHPLALVIDDVHDAVIPDADAPEILVTAQLPAARRSWIGGQAIDLRHQPRDEAVAQVLQFSTRGRLDVDGIFSHASAHA
jgi:hypothetical protein